MSPQIRFWVRMLASWRRSAATFFRSNSNSFLFTLQLCHKLVDARALERVDFVIVCLVQAVDDRLQRRIDSVLPFSTVHRQLDCIGR